LGPQLLDSGESVDVGFVGEAVRVVTKEIKGAIRREVVPVISPIGAGDDGVVLNINADVAASALAAELKAVKLIFVSDVPGIMRDPALKDSLIPTVTAGQIETLIKSKVIAGGMIPKVQSAVAALRQGVKKIHMVGGQIQHGLLLEIFTNDGIGSEIVP
jgi:acetylglutamate kinase